MGTLYTDPQFESHPMHFFPELVDPRDPRPWHRGGVHGPVFGSAASNRARHRGGCEHWRSTPAPFTRYGHGTGAVCMDRSCWQLSCEPRPKGRCRAQALHTARAAVGGAVRGWSPVFVPVHFPGRAEGRSWLDPRWHCFRRHSPLRSSVLVKPPLWWRTIFPSALGNCWSQPFRRSSGTRW